ncbi:MAG: proton-conducting transporter membrane subunit [Rhodospirillales bacterium]
MSPEISLLAAIALPLVATIPIAIAGDYPNVREAVSIAVATTVFILVVQVYNAFSAGVPVEVTLLEMLPGLTITFKVEPLGMIFAGIASFLWIVTTVYAIGYMRGHHERNQTRFFICFAVAIGSALGVAFAGNMVTLFLCYEVLTVSTFPLVAHHGTEESKKAGRTYLGILLGTSVGLQLFAIIWTWVLTGTLDFRDGGVFDDSIQGPFVGILLALYVYGIGKAALMPVHRWLPAAMVAPTPVSALLHAVAVVKAGVFTVVKVVVYIFGIDLLAAEPSAGWLVYMAGFTIIAASVVAMRQDNLKRRLAYSTVSQLSYVIIAAALLTPLSEVGAAFHIAAHAFGKITLFFAAGSILVAAHKTNVSQLNGIGRRMPITMAAFAIGALSMIGLPPTAGFVSKWYILQGAIAADHMVAAAVVVISTLLNAAYFLPIVFAAFFRKEDVPEHADEHGDGHGEAPLPMVLAISVTAVGTVVLFFWPDVALDLAQGMMGL